MNAHAQKNREASKTVIRTFENAIATKDSAAFKKLFFHPKVPFIGVMSEKTEMSIKQDNPDFEGVAVSNASKFIEEICSANGKQKEAFYNLAIESEENVSSISFDYTFSSSNEMVQWGHEKWNLVYLDDQWLITNVTYSIHFPDVEPCPFIK